MVTAVRFIRALRSGSSLPLVVADDDGVEYVVKLSGAGDGQTANVIEWIASGFGRALELPVLPVSAISIGPDLAEHAPDPEISELLARSVGTNLATPYVVGAREIAAGITSGRWIMRLP